MSKAQATKPPAVTVTREEILQAALHLLHSRFCRQSDFVYSVLHGDDPIKAIREWQADDRAMHKAAHQRFKALVSQATL